MKIKNLIGAGALLVAFTFVGTTVVAQTSDVKQDKKEIHHTQDKKAKNIAQRDHAEKEGHAKQAVKDEKKVQKDNHQLHHERKDLHKDKK